MSLIDRVLKNEKERQEILEDYEGIIDIARGKVQVRGSENILKWSEDRQITIADRECGGDFPLKAYFSVGDVEFFTIMTKQEKDKLMELIVDEFINHLEEI